MITVTRGMDTHACVHYVLNIKYYTRMVHVPVLLNSEFPRIEIVCIIRVL